MYVFRNVCVRAFSGASWFNFPQDPDMKISLALEFGAENTKHIMLLCLWRQINLCIMGHNAAEEHLMRQDHMAAWNIPADNLRHAAPRSSYKHFPNAFIQMYFKGVFFFFFLLRVVR